ncbi:MAG: hypothetical protein NTZ61_00090 [Proteobacteria bacterium]|nr:hypothetical protein [Pseudomonadota bacterium]
MNLRHTSTQQREDEPSRWTARLAIAAGVAGGALWLAVGRADPATLIRFADALTRDGRAAQVTVATLPAIQARALRVGAAWLGIVLLFVLARWLGLRAAGPTRAELVCTARRTGSRIGHFLREEPGHALALGAFLLLGASLAGAGIAQPIRCDEATTWLNSVSRSWPTLLASYQTNNHILYSAFAKLACALGPQPPACMRVPALLAGVLVIPASYVAMRVHFGRDVGLLVAGALCTSLLLLDYATNGRSYSFLTLVSALLLVVAPHLVGMHSAAAWIGFAVLASLGLGANPVMVYPLAIAVVWLVARALAALCGAERRSFAWRSLVAAAAVGVAVLAWYSPAYVASGFGPLRDVVRTSSWVPTSGLNGGGPDRLGPVFRLVRVVWRDWTHGRSDAVGWLLLVGGAAGLVAGSTRRACREWWAAIAIGVGAVDWLSGALPLSWIFVFLLPLALGLCFAGVLAAVEALSGPRGTAARPALAVIGAVALALAGVGAARSPQAGAGLPWYNGYPDAAEAAAYLREVLRPGDRIDALPEMVSPLMFHLVEEGTCARDEPSSCLLADGEVAPRIYFVDAGTAASRRRLEALRERSGMTPALARELPASRILRFDRE